MRKLLSESDLELVYELEDGTIEVQHKTDAKIPPMRITEVEVTDEQLAAIAQRLEAHMARDPENPLITHVTYAPAGRRGISKRAAVAVAAASSVVTTSALAALSHFAH